MESGCWKVCHHLLLDTTVCPLPVLHCTHTKRVPCDVASPVACAGLDYVSHDDVLPYTNTSSDVFQHELFGQFFTPTPNQTSERTLSHTHTHTPEYIIVKSMPCRQSSVEHRSFLSSTLYSMPTIPSSPSHAPQRTPLCLLVMSCSTGGTKTSSAWL